MWRCGQRKVVRGESKYVVLPIRAMVGMSGAVMGRMRRGEGGEGGFGVGVEDML